MRRGAIGLALVVSAACEQRTPASLSAAHATSMRDSVVEFLSNQARMLSSAPTIDQTLALYHDSVAFVSDVDPVNPILLLGVPSAPDGSQPVLPGHIAAMTFQYDSLEIVPLAPGIASVLSLYREEITDSTGQRVTLRAGMGLVLQNGPQGWRIRHATASHPDSGSAAWHRFEQRFAKPPSP